MIVGCSDTFSVLYGETSDTFPFEVVEENFLILSVVYGKAFSTPNTKIPFESITASFFDYGVTSTVLTVGSS